MTAGSRHRQYSSALQEFLRPLFWDCSFDELSWDNHFDYIVGRVLSHGADREIVWLRQQIGDDALSDWLVRTQGKALSQRQLRYWELVLDLPPGLVDEWLSSPSRRIWDMRA